MLKLSVNKTIIFADSLIYNLLLLTALLSSYSETLPVSLQH